MQNIDGNILTMNNKYKMMMVLGAFASVVSSEGAIIAYNEAGGAYVEAWGSTGNLVGGAFDGMNISDISASQYFGAENNIFRLIDSNGVDHHYLITPGVGGANAFYVSGAGSTLTGGTLDGQALKNASWIGATNDVNYYVDGTGGVIRYIDWSTHGLHFDAAWTAFTNGELNGQSVTVGAGLVDFGGGNAMNENLYVTIDSNGTMEYYNLDNGFYSAGESEGGYGNWTTFSGGELSGLTLSYLRDNPEGVINGVSYRFLGTSQDGMYFDIGVVPEPSTALLSGLMALGFLRRRRN
jgi:hypothetical protein